jgi:purine nucleosidase
VPDKQTMTWFSKLDTRHTRDGERCGVRNADFIVRGSRANFGRFNKAGRGRCFLPALVAACLFGIVQTPALSAPAETGAVKVIFDTDIGNDVDDVLALSMLHSLQTRGDCELLAVTITKPDELAGPFVDAMNTFYGRPNIPLGFTRAGLRNDQSKFLQLADTKDQGRPRYPHRVKRSSDLPAATDVLRQTLARQADHSLVIVQVGYFSNLAALLDTAGDSFSPLGGRELAETKVRLLSVMAGAFHGIENNRHFLEYNVTQDLAAARKLAQGWPTPIVWSGFEVGIAVPFPAASIERDFRYVAHHPAAEAYCLYNPPPHERPTWDLTAVLYGVLPDRGYFGVSEPGRVTIEPDGFTHFVAEANGRDRFLQVTELQGARVKEALVQLASQPPNRLP